MGVSAFNTHEVMSGNLTLFCSAVDVPCQPHCFENNLLTATVSVGKGKNAISVLEERHDL